MLGSGAGSNNQRGSAESSRVLSHARLAEKPTGKNVYLAHQRRLGLGLKGGEGDGKQAEGSLEVGATRGRVERRRGGGGGEGQGRTKVVRS